MLNTLLAATAARNPQQALLLALAERADVLVDFRGLPSGTRIRLINAGPDEPFGGFPLLSPPDGLPADPRKTKPSFFFFR